MTRISKSQGQVVIYTDGACLGNPGPGGYGAVLLYDGNRKEIAEGFRRTTNNRMEILAAIKALGTLMRPSQVTLYSDSKYVVNAIEQRWAERWRANHWRRNKKDLALNPDLWGKLLDLCEIHDVTFQWVKGHAGIRENERSDQLAVEAASSNPRQTDVGYEYGSGRKSNQELC